MAVSAVLKKLRKQHEAAQCLLDINFERSKQSHESTLREKLQADIGLRHQLEEIAKSLLLIEGRTLDPQVWSEISDIYQQWHGFIVVNGIPLGLDEGFVLPENIKVDWSKKRGNAFEVKRRNGEFNKKVLIGDVVFRSGDRTVKVRIPKTLHTHVGKVVQSATALLVHDANNVCEVGDKIAIMQSRPYSKRKNHTFVGFVSRPSREIASAQKSYAKTNKRFRGSKKKSSGSVEL